MHFSEGGYDAIASKLFRELNADTYYLEYDTARAGGFEPLKDLPKNKSAVLGLISTKIAKLEDIEALKKRIEDAASFVASGSGESKEEALQRLCVSPQCGFASHSDGESTRRRHRAKRADPTCNRQQCDRRRCRRQAQARL